MDRSEAICEAVRLWRPELGVQRIWRLEGGMSVEMFGLEVRTYDGSELKWVARFPGNELRGIFADPVEQEFRTLAAVKGAGLPSPAPIAVLDSPAGRFLLMEFLDGVCTAYAEDPTQYARRCAEALVTIHRVDLSAGRFSFLLRKSTSFQPKERPFVTDLREPEVVETLQRLGDPGKADDVLMHGDFWPGNLLWSDGDISGIVDWENALIGPALADVGMTRLDMYWAFGRDAMDAFTVRYLELNPQPTDALAYWDLRAALRPMPNLSEWSDPYAALGRPDVTGDHMKKVLLDFIELALDRI